MASPVVSNPVQGHAVKQEFPDRRAVVKDQCVAAEGDWVVDPTGHCDFTAKNARMAAVAAAKAEADRIAAEAAKVVPAAPAVVSGADNGDVWSRIRGCESTNNYANKNNPSYRGAYQFSFATWASVGGVGDPADASPAEQDARAIALQARSGWGQWECAAKLGIY